MYYFDICAYRKCSRMVPFTCTSTSLKVDFTQTLNARANIADWQQFMRHEVSTCWKVSVPITTRRQELSWKGRGNKKKKKL